MSIIYFAKPEELKLVDYDGFEALEDENKNDMTVHWRRHGDMRVGFTSGNIQGVEFDYQFTKFMYDFKPRTIVMCGVCSCPDTKIQLGEALVANSSRPLSGKLRDWDITNIQLDPLIENQIYRIDLLKTVSSKQVGFLQTSFIFELDYGHLFSRLQVGDRNLNALDMESWSFMHVTRKMRGQSYPVIKGVVDRGVGKTDEFHKVAVVNSVRLALDYLKMVTISDLNMKRSESLSSHDEHTFPEDVKSAANSGDDDDTSSVAEHASKRPRPAKNIYLTVNQLESKVSVQDMTTLRSILELPPKPQYGKLGVTKYKVVKKLLSEEAQQVLDEIFSIN